jgi:hypothetical protein
MLFKRAERSKISAQVCGACGHAELNVEARRHRVYPTPLPAGVTEWTVEWRKASPAPRRP